MKVRYELETRELQDYRIFNTNRIVTVHRESECA